MSPLPNTAAGLIALAGLAYLAPAHADTGTDTARLLNLMYADTRQDCGAPSRPAFLCSGVLLRGTSPSTARQFYSISPKDVTRNAVSASYLRKDAKFARLAWGYTNGFIFDTVLDNPADHADYKVLCAFPIDAGSNNRQQNGCGDSALTTSPENFCDQMGITTAEQWLARYRTGEGHPHARQCSFDVRSGRGIGTAKMFAENLRAMRLLGAESFNENNEVILAPWAIDVPRSPSILASFYNVDAGLEGARLSQIQWYLASNRANVLPAIRMKLPQTQAEDAQFIYEADLQAIRPVAAANQCSQYVASASWVKYTDAKYPQGIWSLEVKPSDCGRKIPDSQINNFANDLVAAYYLNPEWSGDEASRQSSIEVVRRQLTCHLALGRNLSVWSIEPSRPLAPQANVTAAGCNNIVANATPTPVKPAAPAPSAPPAPPVAPAPQPQPAPANPLQNTWLGNLLAGLSNLLRR